VPTAAAVFCVHAAAAAAAADRRRPMTSRRRRSIVFSRASIIFADVPPVLQAGSPTDKQLFPSAPPFLHAHCR